MSQIAPRILPLNSINADFAARDEKLENAIARAQENLLRLQKPDGNWLGELMLNSTLCSDTVLYMHAVDRVEETLLAKCITHIRRRQLADGGWNIYAGGPSELNATVKAYFALKLAGDSPEAPRMRDARATALRLGGIPRMNTYGKHFLALLGQFPWSELPTMPPEIFMLPKWAIFNVYKVSCWSRTMIAPLTVLHHFKPVRRLPAHRQIPELYPAGHEQIPSAPPEQGRFWTWKNVFYRIDRFFKFYERLKNQPLRRRALKVVERWMVDRMGEGNVGLGYIFPPMLNVLIALRLLGYREDHPVLEKAERDFACLFVDDPADFRIQSCLSHVWDTAITTITLAESGLTEHPALQRSTAWLAGQEIRFAGDWSVHLPKVEPSGWSFGIDSKQYPDTDDTMMVLMALHRVPGPDSATRQALFDRALNWLLAFQDRDGGWAAFDRGANARWLEHVPFADHNAITDPTCSDLTGRVLELLGLIGYDRRSPVVRRAVDMLRRTQEADGCWYGRWGVNYIYGTWQTLRGLAAIGEDMDQDWIRRGRDWLAACQNEDGGWGETCATYDDPKLRGAGPSTPSQTAWALMGLCACPGAAAGPAVQRGLAYLLRTQHPDGSWSEEWDTGTGFPAVIYMKYELYPHHFPLLALATYRKTLLSRTS